MSNQERNNLQNPESENSPDDFMLSMLLEDFVSETEPPDLKPRILSRVPKVLGGVESVVQSSLFTSEEHNEATKAAALDLENGYGTVIPPPIVVARSSEPNASLWLSRSVLLAAALAAAVLGVIFVSRGLKSTSVGDGKSEIAKNGVPSPSQSTESSNKPQDNKSSVAGVDEAKPGSFKWEEMQKQKDAPELWTADTKSAPPAKPKIPGNSVAGSKGNQRKASSELMGNRELVGIVDDQLRYLWNRVSVPETSDVSLDVWLDRASIAIIGRSATTAEKEVFRSNKSADRVAGFADSLIESSEFSRYWSIKLAEHYLGKRVALTRGVSVAEDAFVEWLEEKLGGKVFVGDLERSLVLGPTETYAEPSVRTDPASYWVAETMERAAVNHRDSVDHLVANAKRRQPREESLIGISRQLMRLSGNPSMVCAQCHADEGKSSEIGGYLAGATNQTTVGSSLFWSVPANFSGQMLLYGTGERTLQSSKPKDYFYEDADGRMKLVVSGPPSLRLGDQVSRSLGEWLATSSEPRRGMAELVWGQIFRQPLVPVMGLLEAEGLSERVDLRELLASQVQIRKADLGSLVRWLVLSKAFRTEGIKTDAPWYLKSTEAQIADSQRRIRLFAEYPETDVLGIESGRLPAGKALAWIDQKRSFQKADAATLAQGSSTATTKAPKSTKLDYSEAQVRYLVSIDEPYSQLAVLAKRWAESSMSWPMLLEHTYLATDARFPSRQEREEANKLFEASGSDRAKAVVMIVNARLGSW